MSLLSRSIDPIPALKAQLATVLVERLDGMSQEVAAGRVWLTRKRIGEIRAGNLDDLSLQRLVRCLYTLGDQVEITVIPSGEVAVREARAESARRAAIVAEDRARRRRLADKRRAARQRGRSANHGSEPAAR